MSNPGAVGGRMLCHVMCWNLLNVDKKFVSPEHHMISGRICCTPMSGLFKQSPNLQPVLQFGCRGWRNVLLLFYLYFQQLQSNTVIHLESSVTPIFTLFVDLVLHQHLREMPDSLAAKCFTMFTSYLFTISIAVWCWAGIPQGFFKGFSEVFRNQKCQNELKLWANNLTEKISL